VPRHRLLETFFHRPLDAADFTTVHHDPARPCPEDLELIYSDTALGTRLVERFGARLPASSTSQPSLVADMLELLEVAPGHRVLETGAGTGYNAALLAELIGDQRLVITVEVVEDVVAQTRRLLAGAGYLGITVLCRDGFDGVPERAPFDRIVATWAAPICPGTGPSSWPRTAGCWCRCDTLVGTRCSCSGGRMADWVAGWRAGRVHGRTWPAPRRPAEERLTWFRRASVEARRPTSSPPTGVTVEVLAKPPLAKVRQACGSCALLGQTQHNERGWRRSDPPTHTLKVTWGSAVQLGR
jgi:SAM-dependent methyltransferase